MGAKLTRRSRALEVRCWCDDDDKRRNIIANVFSVEKFD